MSRPLDSETGKVCVCAKCEEFSRKPFGCAVWLKAGQPTHILNCWRFKERK